MDSRRPDIFGSMNRFNERTIFNLNVGEFIQLHFKHYQCMNCGFQKSEGITVLLSAEKEFIFLNEKLRRKMKIIHRPICGCEGIMWLLDEPIPEKFVN